MPGDYAAARAARPPHLVLCVTEIPRAVGDIASFFLMRPILRRLPAGDGHGVIVLPGYMADDNPTRPLRSLLRQLGYRAEGWSFGRNTRLDSGRVAALADHVARTADRTGGKVSLVGWSLGGLLAREIARARPQLVRQVICMGSPLSDDPNHYSVFSILQRFGDIVPLFRGHHLFRDAAAPPPVPSTSIYSRGDGVVAWRASLQRKGPQAENVEVHASHSGLAANPLVAMVVADRLAQREGEWSPFRPQGRWAAFYPKPSADGAEDAIPRSEVVPSLNPAPARTACGTRSRTAAPADRESRAGSAAEPRRSRR